MEELIQSVEAHGILENLIVRPLPGKDNQYELIAGTRRYQAAITAGLEEVPCSICNLTDEQALALALTENLQREDLNAVDETESILQLLALRLNVSVEQVPSLLFRMQDEQRRKVPLNILGSEQGQTVITVFKELGKFSWESFVSMRLPLLNLPQEILSLIRDQKIAYTKAQVVARIKDPASRQTLLEEAIASRLSLNQIKERVNALQPNSDSPSPKATIQEVTRRVTKSRVWENQDRWERVKVLLKELLVIVEQ
jgi:ParB family chromosome partitioning protein